MEAFKEEDEDMYEEAYQGAGEHMVLNTERPLSRNDIGRQTPEVFDCLDNSYQFDNMIDAQRNTIQIASPDYFDDSIQKPNQIPESVISAFDDGFAKQNQKSPSYILPAQVVNS